MAEFTTFKIGGPAQALVRPGTIKEVVSLVEGCRREDIPCHVIGAGSNLLVADEGLLGVVILLGRDFSAIRKAGKDNLGRILVEVEAGCRLSRLLNWCRKESLSGLEFTAGIPGTVGGAVVMNAGAWGREIKDVLSSLTCWAAGEVVSRSCAELDFNYRCWHRPSETIVLAAIFAVSPGDDMTIAKTCREHVAARRSKQPKAHGVAGSIFKNPKDVAAGKLIEDAGLKGVRIGGAKVSEVHANFIVNTGGATADDIMNLIDLIRARVWELHQVWLEAEVEFMGVARERVIGTK